MGYILLKILTAYPHVLKFKWDWINKKWNNNYSRYVKHVDISIIYYFYTDL